MHIFGDGKINGALDSLRYTMTNDSILLFFVGDLMMIKLDAMRIKAQSIKQIFGV